MRIDGANGILTISNMQRQPIQGTTDWPHDTLVLDISEESVGIAFGAWLAGIGQVGFNDVQFDVVGTDVPVTP